MTEGSPMMTNSSTATSPGSGHVAETAAQELVVVFAPKVPPQLEHWLRKRGMRMNIHERVDTSELRSSGAKYVFVDLDALPADKSAVDTVRQLRNASSEAKVIAITFRSDD